MPNWCFNEFRIEIDGDRNDAVEVAKMLSNPDTEFGRERLANTKSPLPEGEFAFEPLEIFPAPSGMLEADPEDLAKLWRDKVYPQHGTSGSLHDMLLTKLLAQSLMQPKDMDQTPSPQEVMQADASALNIAVFGHSSKDAFYESAIGAKGRASDGDARIEQAADGRLMIVARISSGWSPCGSLASSLLQLSPKIREVRVFWIEEGNGFYGGKLADRLGDPVEIDEQNCTSGYEQACEALELPAPEPEEGEEYIAIDYATMREWIEGRLASLAEQRFTPADPAP